MASSSSSKFSVRRMNDNAARHRHHCEMMEMYKALNGTYGESQTEDKLFFRFLTGVANENSALKLGGQKLVTFYHPKRGEDKESKKCRVEIIRVIKELGAEEKLRELEDNAFDLKEMCTKLDQKIAAVDEKKVEKAQEEVEAMKNVLLSQHQTMLSFFPNLFGNGEFLFAIVGINQHRIVNTTSESTDPMEVAQQEKILVDHWDFLEEKKGLVEAAMDGLLDRFTYYKAVYKDIESKKIIPVEMMKYYELKDAVGNFKDLVTNPTIQWKEMRAPGNCSSKYESAASSYFEWMVAKSRCFLDQTEKVMTENKEKIEKANKLLILEELKNKMMAISKSFSGHVQELVRAQSSLDDVLESDTIFQPSTSGISPPEQNE